MRTITIRFEEWEDGDRVRCLVDLGQKSEATAKENEGADALTPLLYAILHAGLPWELMASGMGHTPEEARMAANMEDDIKKAGEKGQS